MQTVIIQLCMFAVFRQIGSEQLNDDSINNNLIKNDTNNLTHINKTEPYIQCRLNEIIKSIEEILKEQIKKSEFQIKYALKPQENLTNDVTSNNRKVRQSQNRVDWDKCALKSELEQHKNLETEHILAIKKELEKLQELVRLLRDQQYVLNMLNDVEKPKLKIDDEDDQKQLVELFKMLKNNLPPQAKIDNDVPFSQNNDSHNDFQRLMTEISKLQKQVENQNVNRETKLKTELSNQKIQLQALENQIENLRNGQAMFINANPNKTNGNEAGPDIVGARTPQNHPLSSKLQRKASNNEHNLKLEMENFKKINRKPEVGINPKLRASNDNFLENLQKILLDNPEENPEIKENPIDLNLVPNSDIEIRLSDLEKQLKISQKMKDLEKKIKEVHQSNAESKNIDNEDEDLRSQIKKLQRQLNNMNKNKSESKSLNEEDLLDELKNLQNAINDLKPKEDDSESKIGGTDIQVMLNKLIGLPVQPVVPISTHSHLTPTQIQVLKKIMALKSDSNKHFSQSHIPSSQYGYGLDATAASGYGQSGTFYNPAYSVYGSNAPYNGIYGNIQETGEYGQSPYAMYDSTKQYYGTPAAFYPGREESGPYGPSQHNLYNQYATYGYPNKYSYSVNPYFSNNAFDTTSGHYAVKPTRKGYSSNPKYGKHSNIAQYLFGVGSHVNNAEYKPNRLENIYSLANGNYGQQTSAGYYGPSSHLNHQPYAPKIIYASNTGNKVEGGLYRPVGYIPNPSVNDFNKYTKTETSGYPKLYGNNIQNPAGVKYEANAHPQSNGYEADQFFRGYKDDDSAGYQSNSPKFYSNPQENSYSGNSYAQQKMDDLQTQIYKLQNVINNLNNPEYMQKPEDQQTIYELDHKINDLKGVINNLAHETNQEHYESGYGIDHNEEDTSNYKSDSDAYYNDDSSKSRLNRFRRDTEHSSNSNNQTTIGNFYDRLSDIVTVINFLSEHVSEVYNKTKVNNTRTVRDQTKHSNGINTILKTVKENRRVIRKANSDDQMNTLYQQVNKLMYFVDNLTEKIINHNKTCANGENCTESKNRVRNKRDTDDSSETDNAMQRIWDGMTALLGSAESDTEDNEFSNSIKKQAEAKKPTTVDVHSQRNHLQQQLDRLKQQLDTKLRTNSNSHSFRQKSDNPQSRSSYYQPMSYYQPGYYQQSHYPQPVYYQTVYDYDDNEKKDKTKKLKITKELKKETKFEKIFTKILDKIIDKVIKAIPIVIRKLLGLEFDLFGEEDSGYGDGYGYGVQKNKKKFGIFSLIPMLIFKIVSNISYFIKKLKKNTFIKTFLVPGFVTVTTAGLVVFLVWWLSGDESESYGYYGYGGNIGYDNSYRNNINNYVYDDDYNNKEYKNVQSRSSQNYAKTPTNDYFSSKDNYKNNNMYSHPYYSFSKKYSSNRYDPSVQKSSFNPINYY